MEFEQLVSAALNAPNYAEEVALIEKACAEASTKEQWEKLLCHFDEKQIGSHIADWANDSAFHPFESAGASVLYFPEAELPFAIAATWSESGVWSVDIGTIDEAEAYIAGLNEEWSEESDEETAE